MRDEKIKPDFVEIDPGPVKAYIKNARAFVFEGEDGAQVRAIVSRDAGRWHISVSVKDRYPTWEEIKAARYGLVPNDRFMVMSLPPDDHYINLCTNAFQLWETSDAGLVALNKGEIPGPDDGFLKKAVCFKKKKTRLKKKRRKENVRR